MKAAYDRVAQLIESGGQTEPPAGVRLAELRQIRKLSQAEVANRAGIKQAAIARIEGRDDILLSTLNRVPSAMNGRLPTADRFRKQTGGIERSRRFPFGFQPMGRCDAIPTQY
jgi:DNA-binding XRE family transcriptional regulator